MTHSVTLLLSLFRFRFGMQCDFLNIPFFLRARFWVRRSFLRGPNHKDFSLDWRYGYKKQVGGLSERPVLPEQAAHGAKMLTAVKDGQLQIRDNTPVWRKLSDDDLVPHEDRVRLWRRLDGHGLKRS